jgi:hypothetical protein
MPIKKSTERTETILERIDNDIQALILRYQDQFSAQEIQAMKKFYEKYYFFKASIQNKLQKATSTQS